MKKIILFLISSLFLPLSLAAASVDDDVWLYEFHLEYINGLIQPDKTAKFSYDALPMQYEPVADVNTSDYYLIVFNLRNKEESRVGFNNPTTTIVALSKSQIDVRAPYFANADHVGFYNKSGKYLFNISVKDSSFCNDNNKCDTVVGENYRNCPNDCHNTPQVLIPTVEPVVTTPEPITQPTITPSITPLPTRQGDTTIGGVLTTTTPSSKKIFTPGAIIMLVGGMLLVILGIVLLRIRKNMD